MSYWIIHNRRYSLWFEIAGDSMSIKLGPLYVAFQWRYWR